MTEGIKKIGAYLLLLVMLANAAAPPFNNYCLEDTIELADWSADDTDEAGKKETEKAAFSDAFDTVYSRYSNWLLIRSADNCFCGVCLESQHAARMLEIPPEYAFERLF